jgi:hypothetical protein
MNLSKDDIRNLRDAISICKVIGIEDLVVEDGKVLAFNPSKTAAIVSPIEMSIPTSVKMGLPRVKELDTRMAMFDECEITLNLTAAEDVKTISITHEKMKVSFRCELARAIEHPKGVNMDIFASFYMTPSELKVISRGIKAMNADTVDITVSSSAVTFSAADVNNELFKIELENEPQFEDEISMEMFTYSSDVICNLFAAIARIDEAVHVTITQQKLLGVEYFNHNVYLIQTA